jgi:hypothetical protein
MSVRVESLNAAHLAAGWPDPKAAAWPDWPDATRSAAEAALAELKRAEAAAEAESVELSAAATYAAELIESPE